MMWLGIDGGGTKTAFVLYDDGLAVLDQLTLPTCHYAQAGLDGMRGILAKGIAWAEERAACSAVRTGEAATRSSFGIGIGMCGYGEVPAVTRQIDSLVRNVACNHPYTIVNDVEAAWAAGLGGADGIVIIAGTGSIAYGVCGENRLRCGGWDYELGDEGSAGWIGKEALAAFTRQADGREPHGPLYNLMRDELELHDDFDVIAWAQDHYSKRGDVAALSPLVSAAAEQGDTSARDIFERAAQEEALMVRTIKEHIFDRAFKPAASPTASTNTEKPAPIPVTYVGGTFRAGNLILGPLAQALPRGCRLVPPLNEPALGPVLLLRKQLS